MSFDWNQLLFFQIKLNKCSRTYRHILEQPTVLLLTSTTQTGKD